MNQKSIILFLSLLCLFGLLSPQAIQADASLKDCLESDSNCLEDVDGEKPPSAENKNDALEADDTKTSSIILNIFKVIFALILIVLLIYVFLTLLKKKNKMLEQKGVLENLGGISVGQQKSIQIVRIGEKVYAIGVGQDVTMLDEIEDKTVVHELKENLTPKREPMSFVRDVLTKKKGTPLNDKEKPTSFTHTLKKELEKLKTQRGTFIDLDNKDEDDRHE